MVATTFAEVKLQPITVEAERDAAGAKILRENILKFVCRNIARAVTTKTGQYDQEEVIMTSEDQRTRRSIEKRSSTLHPDVSKGFRKCKSPPRIYALSLHGPQP